VAGPGKKQILRAGVALVARFSPYPLHLVLELQFLLFQSTDFDVVRSGARSRLVDFLFESPMLLREFSQMSRNRHQLPPKEIADVEIVPHVFGIVQRVTRLSCDV
jgi:hypothetical protein